MQVDLHDCPGSVGDEYPISVTYYEGGCYEGSGSALALSNDGYVYEFNLGHCSCYGPLESSPDCLGTYEKYKNNNDIHLGVLSSDCYSRFIELCDEFYKDKSV
jgi:hypothetical protein